VIEEHRERNEANAPSRYSFSSNRGFARLRYRGVVDVIRDTAKAAEIKKRVYPHLFRHSTATRDAKFLTEHELIVKFGWAHDSSAPAPIRPPLRQGH
jgi:integrase